MNDESGDEIEIKKANRKRGRGLKPHGTMLVANSESLFFFNCHVKVAKVFRKPRL